jgi:hypothetical protein
MTSALGYEAIFGGSGLAPDSAPVPADAWIGLVGSAPLRACLITMLSEAGTVARAEVLSPVFHSIHQCWIRLLEPVCPAPVISVHELVKPLFETDAALVPFCSMEKMTTSPSDSPVGRLKFPLVTFDVRALVWTEERRVGLAISR